MATSNVSGATNAATATTSQDASTKKSAAEDMETRFLTLLMTQLKNQDPLNPTDANQMTAQLSQISTCLLYTSPSPRDRTRSRMPSSA